mmetsp:Transcript_53986/g.145544  ORF Transcript_53986/g.145544 Transcript_53986/m.145544 type:complete len:211 (+) Transcript_53986:203-835(+)
MRTKNLTHNTTKERAQTDSPGRRKRPVHIHRFWHVRVRSSLRPAGSPRRAPRGPSYLLPTLPPRFPDVASGLTCRSICTPWCASPSWLLPESSRTGSLRSNGRRRHPPRLSGRPTGQIWSLCRSSCTAARSWRRCWWSRAARRRRRLPSLSPREARGNEPSWDTPGPGRRPFARSATVLRHACRAPWRSQRPSSSRAGSRCRNSSSAAGP